MQRTSLVFLSLLVLAAVGGLAARSHAGSITTAEAVVKLVPLPDAPLQIVSLKYKGEEIIAGQPFAVPTGVDWMSDLEVTVKNVGTRVVQYVEVQGGFRQRGTDPAPADLTFAKGTHYAYPSHARGNAPPLDLQPGATLTMRPSPLAKQVLNEMIANRKYTDELARNITLGLRMVFYGENEGWYKGHETLRDPENPSHWVRADILRAGAKQ